MPHSDSEIVISIQTFCANIPVPLGSRTLRSSVNAFYICAELYASSVNAFIFVLVSI